VGENPESDAGTDLYLSMYGTGKDGSMA